MRIASIWTSLWLIYSMCVAFQKASKITPMHLSMLKMKMVFLVQGAPANSSRYWHETNNKNWPRDMFIDQSTLVSIDQSGFLKAFFASISVHANFIFVLPFYSARLGLSRFGHWVNRFIYWLDGMKIPNCLYETVAERLFYNQNSRRKTTMKRWEKNERVRNIALQNNNNENELEKEKL